MRKIIKEFENPIDNIIIDIVEKITPFLYRTGHTPNIITTYSFIFGLLSVHYLNKNDITKFVLFYMISYFFDCIDGFMARKYNMTTKFGDLYDHITDTIVFVLILGVVYSKYKQYISTNIILL